jgi:predicted secreted Zn-dependent protease
VEGRGGRRVGIVLLGLAAYAVAGASSVHESVEHYDISGATAQQLRAALNRSGPVDAGGRRYDGLTVWNIAWYPEFHDSGDVCELAAFETSVDIAITLPRWVDRGRAPDELIEQWNEFSRALAEHEREHGAIALTAAATMRKRVGSLPARANCAELEEDVSSVVRAVLREARRAERRFDRTTRHGKKDGARFP